MRTLDPQPNLDSVIKSKRPASFAPPGPDDWEFLQGPAPRAALRLPAGRHYDRSMVSQADFNAIFNAPLPVRHFPLQLNLLLAVT